MLFTDDLVLVAETVEEVEDELTIWRAKIQYEWLMISRLKAEYLIPSRQHGVVKLD